MVVARYKAIVGDENGVARGKREGDGGADGEEVFFWVIVAEEEDGYEG